MPCKSASTKLRKPWGQLGGIGENRQCDRRILPAFLMLVACLQGCGELRSNSQGIVVSYRDGFPSTLGQYRPVKFAFELSHVSVKNPYDRDEIAVDLSLTCPDGTKLSHPGFYSAEHQVIFDHGREVIRDMGRGHWEVRWTPCQTGEYRWAIIVRTIGRSTKIEGVAHCSPTTLPGFIKVSAADPQYFESSDGSFFYPVGHVLRSPSDTRWLANEPGNVEKHRILMQQKTFAYERWFQRMEANHENFCSIWMAPWWLGMEWSPTFPGYEGLGRYNQIHAAQLDRIFTSAEKHGIRILLFVMNHGQLATVTDAEWTANPYRKTNGGPAEFASDVFQNDACERLFEQRLKYILARWGYSPSLFAISLSSETDWFELYYGRRCDEAEDILDGISMPHFPVPKRQDVVHSWLQRMSRYIRNNDIHGHLVSTQFSQIDSGHDVWKLPEFDFALNNCYENTFPRLWQLSESPGGIAAGLYGWARLHDVGAKPKLLAEWGGHHMQNSHARLLADLHAGAWALAMTDCAGSTGYWWWNEIDDANLYSHFDALYKFLDGYDRRGKNLKSTQSIISTRVSSSVNHKAEAGFEFAPHPAQAALVLSNDTEAFAYIYDRIANSGFLSKREIESARLDQPATSYLSLPQGLRAGEYQVEYWDTMRGQRIDSRQERISEPGDDIRRIQILPVYRDVAMKLIRKRD